MLSNGDQKENPNKFDGILSLREHQKDDSEGFSQGELGGDMLHGDSSEQQIQARDDKIYKYEYLGERPAVQAEILRLFRDVKQEAKYLEELAIINNI